LPTYLPQIEVATIADRVRDSVAQVHPDLWSITLLFEAPSTVLDRDSRVAEFTWGPSGQKDPWRKLTTAHTWSSHYNPPTRDSVLKLLEDYGHWFGDDRATVISRLGAPQHVVASATLNGIDTTFVLTYPAASFELWRRPADQIESLDEIRAWGLLPGLPRVISLGLTTRSDLLAKLGPSDYNAQAVADSTILSYALPSTPTALIEFYVVRDTLRLLRWRHRMG